jgi:hypothetical protein
MTEYEFTTQIRDYLQILENQKVLWFWRDEISFTWMINLIPKVLENHGIDAVKIKSIMASLRRFTKANKKGFPDFLILLGQTDYDHVILHGRPDVLLLELKTGKGTLTPEQRSLKEFSDAKVTFAKWHTIRSLEGLIEILSGYMPGFMRRFKGEIS